MWKYYARCLTLLTLIAVFLFLTASPALAKPKITIAGAFLDAEITAAQPYRHKITISLDKGDSSADFVAEVLGYGQELDGSGEALSIETDTSPYSAREFIALDKASSHLDGGGTEEVTATINLPPDDGGRYAIIQLRTVAPGEAGVTTVSAINIILRLTIRGSELIHRGEISQIDTTKIVSGQPIEIFTIVKNVGNHHFRVRGEVTIEDEAGKSLTTIYTPLTPGPILPTFSQRLKAILIPEDELAEGKYFVHSKVMLEDGTVVDEADSSFDVSVPYIPPSPEASIILTPQEAKVLETPDGRFSISFPQGAVISQVEVSLQSYPLEQIPAPPPDFILATTCFRVDGLTGLLAKEATVTVKYTAADLDKVDGDASRLRLARWDEADNQWTVLKTKLDREAMTLSASTNRLSIWAVMVAPPKETNWTLIGGVVAGVTIIALLIYFLAVRQRGYQMRRRKGY